MPEGKYLIELYFNWADVGGWPLALGDIRALPETGILKPHISIRVMREPSTPSLAWQ
jgi:hypothetical protein